MTCLLIFLVPSLEAARFVDVHNNHFAALIQKPTCTLCADILPIFCLCIAKEPEFTFWAWASHTKGMSVWIFPSLKLLSWALWCDPCANDFYWNMYISRAIQSHLTPFTIDCRVLSISLSCFPRNYVLAGIVCVCVRSILLEFGFSGSFARLFRDSFCISKWEHSGPFTFRFIWQMKLHITYRRIVSRRNLYIQHKVFTTLRVKGVRKRAGRMSFPLLQSLSPLSSKFPDIHIAHATHLHCVFDEECCQFSKGVSSQIFKQRHISRTNNRLAFLLWISTIYGSFCVYRIPIGIVAICINFYSRRKRDPSESNKWKQSIFRYCDQMIRSKWATWTS